MARRAPDHTSKAPAARQRGETYFYAAEVVRILGLQGIDYAQLRRLLKLARAPDDQPGRGWARFTFRDVVAIRVGVDLAGGLEALAEGRRLQIAELERACVRLRSLGIAEPLLEVPLRREGRAILADIAGVNFRPATGQLALTETAQQAQSYLATVIPLSREVAAAVSEQLRQEQDELDTLSKNGWEIRPVKQALSM